MHKCATLRMHMHMCRLCTYSLGTRSVPPKSHVFRHLCNYTGMHIDRFDCIRCQCPTGLYVEKQTSANTASYLIAISTTFSVDLLISGECSLAILQVGGVRSADFPSMQRLSVD